MDEKITDPQLAVYYNSKPGEYARKAKIIDACIRVGEKPCRGGHCCCPECPPCERHRNIFDIAERWVRRYYK